MRKFVDLTGSVFGCLTALSVVKISNWTYYDCLCECGNKTVVLGTRLKSGNTRSCGCLKLKALIERSTKHGHASEIVNSRGSLTYSTWMSMKDRCLNPNNRVYKWYGAEGVKVCDRWLESFSNFLEDMGERPGKEYSIDRIEVAKGYEPGNCRWLLKKHQQRNQRNTVFVTFQGVTKTRPEWAEEYGIPYSILRYRLDRGWDIKDALLTPYAPKRNNKGVAV